MAPPEQNRLRLVIFGEQRSGTTLLSHLLSAQAGVRISDGYLGSMLYCAYRELGLAPQVVLSVRQRSVLWQRIRSSERHRAMQLEGTMPAETRTLDELHAHMLDRIAQPGDRVIGHKIHGPIEALPALLELPDVHCVYLIRDARDVLLSRSHRGESALDEPARVWIRGARIVRRLGSRRNLFVVRFEDLVTDPSNMLARLGQWLGFASESDVAGLLDDEGKPKLQNSSHGDLMAAFDVGAIARFRAHASSRLMRFAQWRCASELQRWGYPLEEALDPSLQERVAFARRVLVVEALELPRRAKNALLARALPSLVSDD